MPGTWLCDTLWQFPSNLSFPSLIDLQVLTEHTNVVCCLQYDAKVSFGLGFFRLCPFFLLHSFGLGTALSRSTLRPAAILPSPLGSSLRLHQGRSRNGPALRHLYQERVPN
jgi:hypothetical protein